MTIEEKQEALAKISEEVALCKRCPLYKGTNPVPGEGNANADILFIGEAPGFHEDQQGRPFVGRSGQLLAAGLKRIGLGREDVFIANMIRHRPPNNRDPLPNELTACKVWLDQQIKIIEPKFVVTLGRFAMEKFLPGVFISKAHGQSKAITWEGNNFLLFPMFHPSAALRSRDVLNQFAQDFDKLKKELASTSPTKSEEITNNKDKNSSDNEQLKLI